MKKPPMDGVAHPRLFPVESFDGFGPSRFRPAEEVVVGMRLQGRRSSRLHTGVRDHAPRCPGVYGMIDHRGRIIYVGKAKNLRTRLLSYFRVQSRNPKAGRIIQRTRLLVWEQTGDEFAALLRELELIQTLRPRFNVQGVPGLQRHHYICLGKPPAPYVFVTNRPTGQELGIYGPLIRRGQSEDAARRLNDWFQLRDCPQTVPLTFSDQLELFPKPGSPQCLRFELGTCRGPCAGACSQKDYLAGVRAAKAFLDGRDRSILTKLKAAMKAAADRYEFEKALAFRDRLQALEWLDARLSLLRHARQQDAFVYPLTGVDGRERWYLIHRGQVRAVCYRPTTPDEQQQTAKLMAAAFSRGFEAAVLSAAAVDSVLLVAAWFRKNADERRRLITRVAAEARCR